MRILTLIIVTTFATAMYSNAQRIGINETGNTPDASAILDVESTDKGFLPPRMGTAQRDAINGGVFQEGLTIFNTDINCLQWWNGDFWFDACSKALSTTPNPNLTVSNETYQGQSVLSGSIDPGNKGIGYNGENVPSASTITVDLNNSSSDPQNYALLATDQATGLQYTATGTIAGNATIPVVLNHNEVAIAWDFYGEITMILEGANNTLSLTPRIDIKSIPSNSWVEGVDFETVTHNGETWMDRNLGARRVANASDDPLSHGSHFQWGRPDDGHEITVIHGVTLNQGRGFYETTALNDLASTDTPNHPNFIITDTGNNDWRDDNNNNRWVTTSQGPCPNGYHVPNSSEWENARTGWVDYTDAFSSVLKMSLAGRRNSWDGNMSQLNEWGEAWTSSVDGANGRVNFYMLNQSYVGNNVRALGFSVRCIKD